MANYDHIGWQNRFSFGNDNIYPKCASKKVSEMEISRISWKHIFNKIPLIQMRIDLVQIVTVAYINGTQTYEVYLTKDNLRSCNRESKHLVMFRVSLSRV